MEYKFPKTVVLIGAHKAKEIIADFRDVPERGKAAFGCMNHLYQGVMPLKLFVDKNKL